MGDIFYHSPKSPTFARVVLESVDFPPTSCFVARCEITGSAERETIERKPELIGNKAKTNVKAKHKLETNNIKAKIEVKDKS